MEKNIPEKSGKKKRSGLPIKVLCYTAVFTALSAVANIFTAVIGAGGSLAVSFTYIPNFFAGALLGPLSGFLTGLLGDLIGCWIAPKGDINPIILLASSLMGLIPGLIFKIRLPEKWKAKGIVLTVVSLALTFVFCTVVNTLGLYVFYFKGVGKTLSAVFVMRLPKQSIVWAINSGIVLAIYYPIRKLLKI